MSRKQADGGGANWRADRLLWELGEQLVDAEDDAIDAKAEELGADRRRLKAFVFDARRRKAKASTP